MLMVTIECELFLTYFPYLPLSKTCMYESYVFSSTVSVAWERQCVKDEVLRIAVLHECVRGWV